MGCGSRVEGEGACVCRALMVLGTSDVSSSTCAMRLDRAVGLAEAHWSGENNSRLLFLEGEEGTPPPAPPALFPRACWSPVRSAPALMESE